MSNSVRPHRRQPTRLRHPWDSPGKNTGVGRHFLLQCMKVKVEVKSLSRVQLLATPWTAAYQAPLSMGFSRQEYWSGVPLPSLYFPSRGHLTMSKTLAVPHHCGRCFWDLLITRKAIYALTTLQCTGQSTWEPHLA